MLQNVPNCTLETFQFKKFAKEKKKHMVLDRSNNRLPDNQRSTVSRIFVLMSVIAWISKVREAKYKEKFRIYQNI